MPEPAPHDAVLEAECRTFCRFLIGREPTAYILSRYALAHEIGSVQSGAAIDPIGRLLVSFARRGPFRTRLADSYAVIFANRCLLRRKLVLLLAILESAAPTHRLVDSADLSGASSPGSKAGFFLRAAMMGVGFALAAAAGTIIIIPLRILESLKRP